MPAQGSYEFPDHYRVGGIFLASATWGWWTGVADRDADVGDNDGHCDVYEFWKKGCDFCSKAGSFWYGNSYYNYHPQCTNITVLQSIELGWTSMTTPLPELPADAAPERIFSLLAGSADSGLAENITNVEAYSTYRDWAQTVKADGGTEPVGAQSVRESPMAWMSFALGSDELMEAGLESNDVHIVRFAPAGGGNAGLFSLEVAIDGVSVGSSAAVPQKTLSENLARILKVEGSETIAPSGGDSDGIDIRILPPVNGKARMEASSPGGVGGAFFFRVKIE